MSAQQKMKDITSLGDLVPDPKNARKHTPRNVGMIEAGLREIGAARSGVIDEKGVLLAGNATAEALAQAGIEKVRVVDAKGDEWIVVRRSGLTAKQKRRLALFDNRTAELAEWDVDVLADMRDDLGDMWQDFELEALGIEVPDFAPVGMDEQGRLDEKAQVKCPACGNEFAP